MYGRTDGGVLHVGSGPCARLKTVDGEAFIWMVRYNVLPTLDPVHAVVSMFTESREFVGNVMAGCPRLFSVSVEPVE